MRRPRQGTAGFSLVEMLIATVVLTIGLVGMAPLVGITTVRQTDAREASSSTQLAQSKVNELMKLNFATAPAIQVTPTAPDSLSQDVANYFDTPQPGVTRRWRVSAGPAGDTRLVTVRVVNVHTRQRGSDITLTTIVRQW